MIEKSREIVWALWLTLLITHMAPGQTSAWQVSPTGSSASLRGLAVANQSTGSQPVIWASGSKGTILVSVDRGQSWKNVGPAKHAELEFRSLHAWNEKQAIVASAGTPAIVLKTTDGGTTWQEVWRDSRPQAFFDGLKFLDATRGVLFGDPIDGHFVVLTTKDAGASWQQVLPARCRWFKKLKLRLRPATRP